MLKLLLCILFSTHITCETVHSNSGASIISLPYGDDNALNDANLMHDWVQQYKSKKKQIREDCKFSVVKLFAKRTLEQRLKFADTFKKTFQEDMKESIKKLFGPHSKSVSNILDLLLPVPEYLAGRIDHSLKLRYDDWGYLSIICTSNGAEFKSIIDAYQKVFQSPLKQLITDEVREIEINAFLNELIDNNVNSNGKMRPTDKADAKKTEDFVKAIPDKEAFCSKNENKALYDLMLKESFDQIRAVGNAYKNKTGVEPVDRIKQFCVHGLQYPYLRILAFSMNSSDYFAKEAYDNVDTGTDADKANGALARILVSRCEIDLRDIGASFQRMLGSDFGQVIQIQSQRPP